METDEIYKLTDKQKAEIEIGLQQIEKGEIISNEDLDKEMDLWFSSKQSPH